MQNRFEAEMQTLQRYKRYKEQILLDMIEAVSESKEDVLQDALAILHKNEYYYHCEDFQKIIIGFLYFQDFYYLEHYLEWRCGVYMTRKIEIDFLILENELLLKRTLFYLQTPFTHKLKKLHEHISAFYAQMRRKLPETQRVGVDGQTQLLYALALEGKRDQFAALLLQNASTLEAFCLFFTQTLSKVLAHIGKEWQHNAISVAQEHRASAAIREEVFALLKNYPLCPPKNEKVFVSSVGGEAHTFGIDLSSEILRHLGYEVAVLGSKFSNDEIVNALYEFEPKYLLLILTLPSSLVDLAQLLEKINRENLPTRPECYVAGHALTTLSNPYSSLECDYYFTDFVDF